MARHRGGRLLGSIAAACALASAGCAGVPHTSAVHKAPAAPNVQGGVFNPAQQAQGPAPGESPTAIVDKLMVAMSDGDDEVAASFFTKDQSVKWLSDESHQTVVFTSPVVPAQVQKRKDEWSVVLEVSGIIDETGGYRRASGNIPVTFTFVQVAGESRISDVQPRGRFVRADSLSQVVAPVQLYFPSAAAAPGTIPRLVPDSVFLTPQTSQKQDVQISQVIQVLLGGPTNWLAHAVATTVPPTAAVLGVQTDARGGLTTINLAGVTDRSQLATLKAQIAYTLASAQYGVTNIQLDLGGVPQGNPFSYNGVNPVNPGYNPDVLVAGSPLYYITRDDSLVSLPGNAQPTQANGLPNGADQTPPTTVLAHAEGAQQIAVADAPNTDGSTTVAGVGVAPGGATLELTAALNTAPDPWTTVGLPIAKSLTTPSFQAGGSAVWTVVQGADSSTKIYRIPLSDGIAGSPTEVLAYSDDGTPAKSITALRLSRDGARVALIAGTSQAYVGVVIPPRTPDGAWSIGGLRPVITVDANTFDSEVYWADQTTVGVLTTYKVGTPAEPASTLYTVSSDGYTQTSDGTVIDRTTVGGNYSGAVQFAGGPGQPWVASSPDGALTRQPAPDSAGEAGVPDKQLWDPLGDGTWPTYAG